MERTHSKQELTVAQRHDPLVNLWFRLPLISPENDVDTPDRGLPSAQSRNDYFAEWNKSRYKPAGKETRIQVLDRRLARALMKRADVSLDLPTKALLVRMILVSCPTRKAADESVFRAGERSNPGRRTPGPRDVWTRSEREADVCQADADQSRGMKGNNIGIDKENHIKTIGKQSPHNLVLVLGVSASPARLSTSSSLLSSTSLNRTEGLGSPCSSK